MKILLITNRNSPKRKIGKEFEKKGHNVEIFLTRAYSRGKIRSKLTEKLPGYTRASKKVLRPIINRKLDEKILQFNPDLIVGDKAGMINQETLKDVEAKKILWFPDDPQLFNLGRNLSKSYNLVLTNSPCVLDNYPVKAKLFPFPMQEEEMYGKEKKKYDVSFIGRSDEKRRRYIETIAQNFKNSYVGGPEWNPENFQNSGIEVEGKWLSQEEMIKKYEQSRIVINIAKTREHVTHRIFEAGATHSTVLSERTSGIKEFYTENEIPTFEDPQEMVEKIEKLLEDGKRRKVLTKKSREKTKEKYKLEDLASKIIKQRDANNL